MSGTTAEPAAAEGWLTKVWPGASEVEAANDQADPPQYVGAYSEKKDAGNTADSAARTRSKVSGKEDLFRPGPQYDEKYDPQGNVDIYGKKIEVEAPRPPIELGRQQYTSGSYDPSSTALW